MMPEGMEELRRENELLKEQVRLQHGLRVTKAALMAMTRRNSHGSKSRRGARDTAVVMSVVHPSEGGMDLRRSRKAVTRRRRGEDFLEVVQEALTGGRGSTP